jgi:hypothetical protein
MVRRQRTIRAKILVPLVTCLLLCAVASAEVPELLSLADRVANDFTICRANSSPSPVLRSNGSVRLDGSFVKVPELASCEFQPPNIEEAELSLFDLLALHSVRRI